MARKQTIYIDQGSTFSNKMPWLDANNNSMNLNSYTAAAQMKEWYTSNSIINFSANVTNNYVTISLTAAVTANIQSGRYLYDVLITDTSNNITRMVEGLCIVNPGVTNEPSNIEI